MKIKAKIFLPFFVTALFLSISGVSSFYFFSGKLLKEEILNHLWTAAQSRSSHIKTHLDGYYNIVKLTSADSCLKDFLTINKDDSDYDKKLEEVKLSFNELHRVNAEHLNYIQVLDEDGTILISTLPEFANFNRGEDDIFIEGKSNIYISDIYIPSGGEKIIMEIAAPVIEGDVLEGVVIIGFSTDKLFTITQGRTGLEETGEIYLVNKEGYLASPAKLNRNLVLKQKVDTKNYRLCSRDYEESVDESGEFKEHEEILFVYEDYDGKKVLGTHDHIPEMDWCLLAEISEEEAMAPMNRLFILSFIITIFVLLVVSLVINVISGIITRPIKELRRGVKIIESGNLDYKVGIKSEDEVGELSRAFDKMTAAIKRSRRDVDKKVENQTKEIVESRKMLEEQQAATLNVLEDVNEEKEKASHERDKVDAILQSIGDGVFVIDRDYKIIVFNKISESVSGYSSREAMGKRYDKVLKFVFEGTEKVNNKFIKKVFETGKVHEMGVHNELIRKDGTRIPVNDSAAPLKDDNGNIIACVVVFRDVTKEREIDRAKTEFVSLASHQLRTPLSAINWYTEMLLAGDAGKINKNQKQYLEEVYHSNQRMVDLVNALLNVSRIEMGTLAIDPEPTNIVNLADEVFHDLEQKIQEKKIKITKKYEKGISNINLDPRLMRIVFQNILSNAIKYTPSKGSVDLNIKKKGSDILITIKDSGYGIPKKQQTEIFTKLFRADNVRERETDGTGLGLYIVKYIVEKAGGKVWFKSTENKGTTFFVSLSHKGMKKQKGTKGLNE